MDVRYPIPVSLDTGMPRFVAVAGMTESPLGTWVPIEYVELLGQEISRLSDRVAELEARTNPYALALWGQDMEHKGAAAEREAIVRFLRELGRSAYEGLRVDFRVPGRGGDALFYAADLVEQQGKRHETTSPSTTSSTGD